MTVALAVGANFCAWPVGHSGRRGANTLGMAFGKASVALQRGSWPRILAFAPAFPESIDITAVFGHVRGPRRGCVRPGLVARGGCCTR
jgi:hypothetical protein